MINQKMLTDNSYIKYSVAGYEFDIRNDIWNLKKSVAINFSYIHEYLEKRFHEGFIYTFSYFAQEYKPLSVSTNFHRVKAMLLEYKIKNFSEHELISIYSDLKINNYEKFRTLKHFLMKWKDLGYYGIDDNAYEYLKMIKIPEFSHGDVVKRRDPNVGPLTEQEINMIVDGLERGRKEGLVSDCYYTLTMLLILSGRRNTQIMSLKHRDVINNEKGYFLNIPRAKQKSHFFRGSFRELEISEKIWRQLVKLMSDNINKVKDVIGEDQDVRLFDDLPIFLSTIQLGKVSNDIDFYDYLKDDFLHIGTRQVRRWLKKFPKCMKIHSPRTGKILNINSMRFRYTYGTLLARNGGNLSTIAFAMDHSSEQSAGYYIKNLCDNVNVIDKAVGCYLKDISGVFLGKRDYQGDLLKETLTMDIRKVNENDRSCENCQHYNKWNKEVR